MQPPVEGTPVSLNPGAEDHSVAMVTHFPAADPRGVYAVALKTKKYIYNKTTLPTAEYREHLERVFGEWETFHWLHCGHLGSNFPAYILV